MASIANRQSLLVARDELELVGSQNAGFCYPAPNSAFVLNGNAHQHHFHPNFLHPDLHQPLMPAEGGNGPLSTIRRSLRQMNPFKSRLFRLPATPRLSRSKKVLGRGEDFTGWNFERPGQNNNGSTQSSASNSLRPLSSSSFGPVDFEYRPGNGCAQNDQNGHYFQRRFSNVDGGYGPPATQFPPSPIFQRRTVISNVGCDCCERIEQNGAMEGGDGDSEGIGDLDEFLDAMESISKRGQIGGSCRVMTAAQKREEMLWNGRCQGKGGTVAGGPLPPTMAIGGESGAKRNRRPPIPSFNPPGWPQSPSTAYPPGQMPNGRIASNGNYPPQNQRRDREESPYLQLLPSTCYSPNGEMYAARWRPGQSLMAKSGQFNGGSPQLSQRGRQRPQPLYLPGGQLVNPKQNEPKSPSQSTITLLNTQMMAAMGGGGGMRSASTVSSASTALRQQQKSIRPPQPAPSIGLFPQTQLQRRRSACSASAALETGNALGNGHNRDRSIAEEEEDEERAQTASGSANYYGRDILKLMGLEQKAMGPLDSAENSPSLLPTPPLLFPTEDELFIGAEEEFIGREWLFKELCQQLLIERAKLVILMGQSGCGKSAILRQIVANSHFCAPQKIDSPHQSADQHNTVDSGIAVSGGGGNSSGSQLSLLNISLAPPPPFADPIASPSSSLCPPQNRCPSPTPSNGRNYEWLRTLGRQICAFHFAHLHDANSCALPEFIRSICAQFCRCPQLKQNYGKMIRSNPNLHRLATQESAALCLDPMELFRQLILHPIGQLYAEEEQRKRKGAAKRCASKGSDYGGSNFDSSDRNPLPSPSPLPPSILVCIDGLDEAGFHRTDGGESIGWLLRRSLPEWPPQLRFVASLAPGPGSLCEQNSIFGTLAEGEKPLEARTIRLDDWELDERIGRDARLFVEAKVHQSPALEKWVSGQFRRQSFFAASSSPPSPHPFQIAHQANLGEFAAQLAQHCRANYPILQLSLAMLAEGRVLSLGNLPADIGQLYALHFRHKFQCASRFEPISQILGILLASLHPLDFDQLLVVLNSAEGEKGRRIGADELRQRMAQLAPLICQLPHSGRLIPFHASLREWLLKEAGSTEFGIDIRQGHILLAHSLLNSPASPIPAHFFELAHHLLKANPHKYMRPELAAKLGMPQGRDAQIQWLRMGAEGNGKRTATPISNSLLFQRNVFYPNSKVSRLLLLAGADPNASNWPNGMDQSSLLCAFSRAGNAEMVQLLLQFGANPNFGSPSPLILAIQNGHEPVARLLCANGADLTAKDAEGRGPLWHSAANDSLAMLGFLLDTFGDAEGKSGKRTEKLEENGENGRNEGPNRQQYSSACSSAAGGYEEEIMPRNERPMQREKANTAQNRLDRNEAIREAFECAAERGSVRICRFLLDCTDALLDTSRAMCIACANGRSEVVQFLLSRGATLAPDQTWNGKSALICAVESGSWDLVVNVLNGASQSGMGELNAVRGPDRLSPLMVAARHGHVGLVDLLVNRGAHLDAADAHGRTAAMHAIEAGHTSTVGLLLERGCSTQARDGHGNTMLHLLGRHPRKCLINRLLEAGLSLEDKNREDLRPIEVAIQCGQLAAVDAFLRRGARLRSLTWQIALASHPPLILVLLRKLLDDAQILLRRKRPVEAQHRLKYAQQKCEEMLGMAEEGANPREALRAIRPQLRRYKIQSLLAMASLKRKANNLLEAISLATQALEMLDTDLGLRVKVEEEGEGAECSTASSNSEAEEDADGEEEEGLFRFDLHLLRAKCHFDARDLTKARVDAQMAARLRPMDQEAKSLLAILGTGWGQIG